MPWLPVKVPEGTFPKIIRVKNFEARKNPPLLNFTNCFIVALTTINCGFEFQHHYFYTFTLQQGG